jgi:hypothetical protein
MRPSSPGCPGARPPGAQHIGQYSKKGMNASGDWRRYPSASGIPASRHTASSAAALTSRPRRRAPPDDREGLPNRVDRTPPPAGSRHSAAQAGRAALAPLPGFRTGDALTSAVLTAAAPTRSPFTTAAPTADWAPSASLSATHPAATSRCIEAIGQLLSDAPAPIRNWTARELDAQERSSS